MDLFRQLSQGEVTAAPSGLHLESADSGLQQRKTDCSRLCDCAMAHAPAEPRESCTTEPQQSVDTMSAYIPGSPTAQIEGQTNAGRGNSGHLELASDWHPVAGNDFLRGRHYERATEFIGTRLRHSDLGGQCLSSVLMRNAPLGEVPNNKTEFEIVLHKMNFSNRESLESIKHKSKLNCVQKGSSMLLSAEDGHLQLTGNVRSLLQLSMLPLPKIRTLKRSREGRTQ